MEAALCDWRDSPALDPPAQLRAAREVMRREATGLWDVSNRLDDSVPQTIELILRSSGSVIVTGMGKAGWVAQKISATFSSTGTRSHFLHPAEAFHGDLGRVDSSDVVLILSQSGETEEVIQLLPSFREMKVPIVAITSRRHSTLGRAATHVIELGDLEEACSLGLAPSTSTTAMLALGDALALVLSKLRGFRPEDFARFHPGGSLGRRLSKVEDHMRPLHECRLAATTLSVREVVVSCSRPGRRTGAVMLTDAAGRLAGLFTDSDLARLVERRDDCFDAPVASVMTIRPATIQPSTRMQVAVDLMAQRKISELPVVDQDGKPLGLLDVTDIVGFHGAARDESPADDRHLPSVRLFRSEEIWPAG